MVAVSLVRKRKRRISAPKFWSKLSHTEPNNAEMSLLGILSWLGLPFKYVGNAQYIIHGRCPDFVHSGGENKFIELFGERWHKPEEEVERIEFFRVAGFETLVIWNKELKMKNRANLYRRLREFSEKDYGHHPTDKSV